jgi:hypothetical protein
LFCGDCPATAVVLLLKLGENEVSTKKSAEHLFGRFPVPSHKIAFLFEKTQDLQEEQLKRHEI